DPARLQPVVERVDDRRVTARVGDEQAIVAVDGAIDPTRAGPNLIGFTQHVRIASAMSVTTIISIPAMVQVRDVLGAAKGGIRGPGCGRGGGNKGARRASCRSGRGTAAAASGTR